MKNIILLLAVSMISLCTMSQVLGPSVQEVNYKYKTKFQISINQDYKTDLERAEFHASHLFGLFHSPKLIQKFGLDSNLVGGLGGPKTQMKIKIIKSSQVNPLLLEIEYENKGQMLLHQKVAAILLLENKIVVDLPSNPYLSYDKKCTDEHYDSFGDYWYFYDIYRLGCEYLSEAPFAVKTTITITKADTRKIEQALKLPTLRGDNGNGDLFSIAIIQGFADSTTDTDDSGRENFKETNQYLISHGFRMSKVVSKSKFPLFLFQKSIVLSNGKLIYIEIQHLLVETSISAKTKVFAQFFKDAAENADVIIYSGHSGLGGNLDLPSLEKKAGKFKFNKNKKQIFYFDSCSSYSYYLDHFKVEKTKAKIDVVTNGLSSYFHTSKQTMSVFLDYLTSKKSEDVLWMSVLTDMEKVLDGHSYLINVGGI